MIFETKRLIGRNFEKLDFNGIHDYASSPEIVRYMAWGPNTIEDTVAFMTESIQAIDENPRRRYELVIEDKDSGEVIGAVALYITGFKGGEIGYSIRKKYWGKGYATEGAMGIMAYGFDVLKLHRIQATCDVRNTGSAHVLDKLGMKREGTIREHIMLRDGWRDSYLYSILEHEYHQQK